MDYQRKSPLDYKDISENLRNPAWYGLENDTNLLDDAATAITDLLARAETAEKRADRWEEEVKAYSESDLAKAHDLLSEDWAKQKIRADAAEARAEKAEKEVDQYKQFLQNWHEHEEE